MTIDDYADWAASVAKTKHAPTSEQLAYLGLGLAGESGEVAEHVKKLLRDGRLDEAAMAEELGDVVYYWACLCTALGRKPSDVLAASQAKIGNRLAQ
jgi:NTP pyrophosphatase (non-canonical NTP hydrolase)